ncbi:MAG: sialate O-acetylesterase [Verrucomicrobiota bacterium]
MTAKTFRSLTCVLSLLVCAHLNAGQIWLPELFSDGMVLQEGKPVAVWGKAGISAEVSVAVGEVVSTAHADESGKWRVNLKPLPAGGPYQITIRSGAEEVCLNDVLAGQVWLCSGQSNMGLELSKTAEAAAPVASDPLLRVFTLPRQASATPEEKMSVRKFQSKPWIRTLPETASGFSAVAYYFGKAIREATGQPVGMIVAAVGGTEIDTWTDKETLESNPELKGILERWNEHVKALPALEEDYTQKMAAWTANSEKGDGSASRRPPHPPTKPGERNSPSANFNAMLNPLIPYTIRGFLWYQGENDAVETRSALYEKHFPIFIRRMRQLWGDEALPFYFVQIANYGPADKIGGGWPEIREGQRKALSLPKTGMAVAIDIGDAADIHPKNKKDVGIRLARHALANEYGKPMKTSGPLAKSARQNEASVVVEFAEAEGLNVPDGAAPGQFEVAGETGEFVKATGKIVGGNVILAWPGSGAAKAVRYAWAGNPMANLYNAEKLPASPFQLPVSPGE